MMYVKFAKVFTILVRIKERSLTLHPSYGVTKQYKHSPLIACGAAPTAASATFACSTKTDSTCAVDIKCPETEENIF